MSIRTFARDNGLSLAFGGLFLVSLAGQTWSGLADFNDRQLAHGDQAIGLLDYLTSSSFAVDVATRKPARASGAGAARCTVVIPALHRS
jgi:hypothetical protein